MFPVVLYQYTPPLIFKGTAMEIKLHNLSQVIPAIAPYGEPFYYNFNIRCQ